VEKVKHIVVILALLLLSAGTAQAQLGLEQAAEAYQAGDYPAAIALWETAHQNNLRDGALYYNLGAAYYQSGDLAHALVNIRRAAAYAPRDTEVQTLLARIRAERLDPPVDETDILILVGAFTDTVVTLPELAALSFGSYVLFFVCIAAYGLRPNWRIYTQWVVGCLALVVIISLVLLGSRTVLEQQRPIAVVTAPTAQVMSGPGLDYLPLFSIMNAAEVRLLEARPGWVRVGLPDGRQGWLSVEGILKVWES
jgi:hypothetical protein